MPPTLDVYRDWLSIKDVERPLNHYQILRLKKFEDDTAKIREHYRKMNAHVRKFGSGEFAQQSQDLLNELAKAMLALTDVGRKREYDATLGRTSVGESRRRTMEEILLSQKAIDETQLNKARNYARAVGVDTRDALMQQKLAKPEVVMPAYAESIGLPYLDLGDLELDASLMPLVPAVMARQHSLAPVLKDQNQLLVASPNPLEPNIEEELRLRFGVPVRTVLCTPAAINQVIGKYFSRDAAAAAAPVKAPVAAVASGAAPAAPSAQAAPEDTAEAKKRRRLIAIMVFNFGSLGTVLYQLMFQPPQAFTTVVMKALLMAAVLAGATWGTMTALKK